MKKNIYILLLLILITTSTVFWIRYFIVSYNHNKSEINTQFNAQSNKELQITTPKIEINSSTDFVSIWQTNNTGKTENNQIALPLQQDWEYDFTVDWWDKSKSKINSYKQSEIIHTYYKPWIYTITISGKINGFAFNLWDKDSVNLDDWNKLIDIIQWWNVMLSDWWKQFSNAQNLNISAKDTLNTSNITDMSSMFYRAYSFDWDITKWDTSNVINMEWMFQHSHTFNQDIWFWKTSNVTNMKNMFRDARVFNQDISQWDTSSVISIVNMFSGAESFNQPIGSWDTSNITNMMWVFSSAKNFNKDISNWDTSSVENMRGLFFEANSFNQEIWDWNISNVKDMENMFYWAKSFNHDLSMWNTSQTIKYLNFDTWADSWILPKPVFK